MALSDVYDAIADFNVTVNAKTPTVYKPGTTPEQVHSANLPCRIIMPMHSPAEGAQTRVRTFGGAVEQILELEDVLLFESVSRGDSLGSKVADLTGYVDTYKAAFSTRHKVSESIWIKYAKFQKTILTYPEGGDTEYLSVIFTLTVEVNGSSAGGVISYNDDGIVAAPIIIRGNTNTLLGVSATSATASPAFTFYRDTDTEVASLQYQDSDDGFDIVSNGAIDFLPNNTHAGSFTSGGDLALSNALTASSITTTAGAVIGTTLAVTGATTLAGVTATSASISGALSAGSGTITGDLDVGSGIFVVDESAHTTILNGGGSTSALSLVNGRLVINGTTTYGEAIKVSNSDIINFDYSIVRADQYRASAVSQQLEFRGGTNPTRWLNSTGGSELMRLMDAGSLGLGTTDPKAKFHTSGGDFLLPAPTTAITDGDMANGEITAYDSSGDLILKLKDSSGTVKEYNLSSLEI